MRGKAGRAAIIKDITRITPAYAGKRHRSLLSCATTPDHSRICGEKDDDRHFGRTDEGSPPHMRGKVLCAALSVNLFRITPAYAGKSLRLLGFPRSSQDHPRICGEKLMNISTPTALQGSPPRMRGKAGIAAGTCRAVRITPAYAGKSLHGKGRGGAAGDHPRICGEKKIERMVLMMAMGSPPHMRGKGYTRRAYRECPRITPAYAGKSCSFPDMPLLSGDHPRICGEKEWFRDENLEAPGSPPHMRGKGRPHPDLFRRSGITPAYAGKSFQEFPS